jgi:hypothetical protein
LLADFLLRKYTKKAACWAAFSLIDGWLGPSGTDKKVFNTTVVENRESILVSDLFAYALALCTRAGAGTLVVRRPGAERG